MQLNPITPLPQATRDKNLQRIYRELSFIRRQAQHNIEGNFETVDEICLSVQSALKALDEYEASLLPASEAKPLAA